MYNNIGTKIKWLAKIIAWSGIIVSTIIGLMIFFIFKEQMENFAFIGFIIIIAGSLIFWISGFFVYGFGELIDQTQQITEKLYVSQNDYNINEKIAKLNEWRARGLITEQEYQEKLATL